MSAVMEESLRAPVECMIKIDDREITDLYPYIKSVEVRMSRSSATTCAIQIDTLRDEHGEWLVEDQNPILPWQKVMIEARFGEIVEEVMRGYVRDVQVQHPQDMSASIVTVNGQDDSLLLDREHIRHTWSTEEEQLSDGQIADEIATNYGLSSDTESGLQNASLNQDGTSIEFLKKRAEANGFELYFRNGSLNFHESRLTEAPQPTIMVYAGRSSNCLSFNATYDGHLPDQVRVERAASEGTDPETETVTPNLALLGTTAADSSSMGLPSYELSMDQPQGATSAEAEARALAAANSNSWKIQATGELDGSLYGHVLLTHKTVEVDGVGNEWGGKYYVDEVTHKFSLEGYRQSFKLLRNATGQQL